MCFSAAAAVSARLQLIGVTKKFSVGFFGFSNSSTARTQKRKRTPAARCLFLFFVFSRERSSVRAPRRGRVGKFTSTGTLYTDGNGAERESVHVIARAEIQAFSVSLNMSVSLAVVAATAAALLGLPGADAAYYLPGISPVTYQTRDPVKLFVSKLTSTKTQAPYDYYSLPYCKPTALDRQKENLGQVISGDRIEASTYKLETKVPKACEVACVVKLTKQGSAAFIRAVDEEYRVHWVRLPGPDTSAHVQARQPPLARPRCLLQVVDSLPVGMFNTNADRETVFRCAFAFGPPGNAACSPAGPHIQAHQPSLFRCAFGPPGNASSVWRVPHIQAHQPLSLQRLPGLPPAAPSARGPGRQPHRLRRLAHAPPGACPCVSCALG